MFVVECIARKGLGGIGEELGGTGTRIGLGGDGSIVGEDRGGGGGGQRLVEGKVVVVVGDRWGIEGSANLTKTDLCVVVRRPQVVKKAARILVRRRALRG
jgi:hypothetical protein